MLLLWYKVSVQNKIFSTTPTARGIFPAAERFFEDTVVRRLPYIWAYFSVRLGSMQNTIESDFPIDYRIFC